MTTTALYLCDDGAGRDFKPREHEPQFVAGGEHGRLAAGTGTNVPRERRRRQCLLLLLLLLLVLLRHKRVCSSGSSGAAGVGGGACGARGEDIVGEVDRALLPGDCFFHQRDAGWDKRRLIEFAS